MGLMHSWLQTSLPSKVVLATCSVLDTSHRGALAGGTLFVCTAMACVGFGIQGQIILCVPCVPSWAVGRCLYSQQHLLPQQLLLHQPLTFVIRSQLPPAPVPSSHNRPGLWRRVTLTSPRGVWD